MDRSLGMEPTPPTLRCAVGTRLVGLSRSMPFVHTYVSSSPISFDVRLVSAFPTKLQHQPQLAPKKVAALSFRGTKEVGDTIVRPYYQQLNGASGLPLDELRRQACLRSCFQLRV